MCVGVCPLCYQQNIISVTYYTSLITFILAGISCARAPRQTEDSLSGKPYGKQALIMHREVEVEVDAFGTTAAGGGGGGGRIGGGSRGRESARTTT